ncbi:MAG: hypothetical protein JWN78_1625 [Bacteroidota bacterium]|nr:hypothetical protein [Bacteroidota bacterium]
MHASIDVSDCINSIHSALKVKDTIVWEKYFIATNANFSPLG